MQLDTPQRFNMEPENAWFRFQESHFPGADSGFMLNFRGCSSVALEEDGFWAVPRVQET